MKTRPKKSFFELFLPDKKKRPEDYDLILKLKASVVLNIVILLTTIYFVYRFYTFYHGWRLFSIITLFLMMFSIFLFYSIKRGRPYKPIASFLLIVFISLNIILTYHNAAGVSLGMLWSFVITILSIFLLGPLHGGLLAASSLAGQYFLYTIHLSGRPMPNFNLPHDHTQESTLMYFVIFLSVIAGLVTWLYELSRNRAWKLEKLKHKQLKKHLSQRLSLQKKLEESHQSLEEINRTLESRIQQEIDQRLKDERLFTQQARMAAMGEMVGAIAHQWRQPLNSLALVVQDLREAEEAGELDKQYLNEAVEQSMDYIQHMSQTIDDFRSFLKPSLVEEKFDLVKAVLQSVKISKPQIVNHDIDLVLNGLNGLDGRDKSEQPVTVFGYPNEFKQVILNLIGNAKDAIEEKRIVNRGSGFKGKITITFERDPAIKIFVEDNGLGIPSKVIDRIFDPYFTTKDPTVGTGIGLYLSKEIIEKKMSGFLFVENIEPGARFTIILNPARP